MLSPDLSALIYATFFGGDNDEHVCDLAVRPDGSVVFTGFTGSADFPAGEPLTGTYDVALCVLKPDLALPGGEQLPYSALLKGTGMSFAYAVATDGPHDVIIAGDTEGFTVPIPDGAFDPNFGGAWDAFVARVRLPLYEFRRGDANADGKVVDISDAVFVLQYLFASGPEPPCLDAADANDQGAVDISDGVYILQNLFSNGPAIPPPYPNCGTDPTADDDMDCLEYQHCP